MVRRVPRPLAAKDIEKKVNLMEESQDEKKKKKKFLIFLCYEVSVCPLLLNSDNVYFASSLIAKPNWESLKMQNIKIQWITTEQ